MTTTNTTSVQLSTITLESIHNLEPHFIVTDTLEAGMNRHKKPIYIDSIHNWCVLDISTPTHKHRFTIIDLDKLQELSQWVWKYTPYVNKKTGNTNEYVQTVVCDPETKKQICTTINRVILFGFGSKTKLVSDHTRQNKLDNRRMSLNAITHQQNLKRAADRPWEGAALVHRKAVKTPDGEFESLTAAAKHYGITSQAMGQKVKRGAKGYELVEKNND